MMRSMYSHRHSGRITHLNPHPASDIDAGPAVRVWPGRVGDSLPDNIWAQLLAGPKTMTGALKVWAPVPRRATLPADNGRRLDAKHPRHFCGSTQALDQFRHAAMLGAPSFYCKSCLAIYLIG